MTDSAFLIRIAFVAFAAAGLCIIGDALSRSVRRAAAFGRTAVTFLLCATLVVAAAFVTAILSGDLPRL